MPIEIESADDPRVADYLGLRDKPEHSEYFIAESELVVTRTSHQAFLKPILDQLGINYALRF